MKLWKEITNIKSYGRMFKSRNCSVTFSFDSLLTRSETFVVHKFHPQHALPNNCFLFPSFKWNIYFFRPHIRRHQSPPPHTKTKKYHSTWRNNPNPRPIKCRITRSGLKSSERSCQTYLHWIGQLLLLRDLENFSQNFCTNDHSLFMSIGSVTLRWKSYIKAS